MNDQKSEESLLQASVIKVPTVMDGRVHSQIRILLNKREIIINKLFLSYPSLLRVISAGQQYNNIE